MSGAEETPDPTLIDVKRLREPPPLADIVYPPPVKFNVATGELVAATLIEVFETAGNVAAVVLFGTIDVQLVIVAQSEFRFPFHVVESAHSWRATKPQQIMYDLILKKHLFHLNNYILRSSLNDKFLRMWHVIKGSNYTSRSRDNFK